MAPFGKIYTYPNNPRVLRALVIADMNGLEIEIPPFVMRETNRTPDFLSKFPLGKVPAFEGADGFCLTESVAIATYLAKSGPKADQLLGLDPKTQALIAQWTAFSEAELFNNVFVPIAMVALKLYPLDEKRFHDHMAGWERDAKRLETALEGGKKFLVGDQLTLADLVIASLLHYTFKFLMDAKAQKEYPNLTAYIQAFTEIPAHKKHFGALEACEARVSL